MYHAIRSAFAEPSGDSRGVAGRGIDKYLRPRASRALALLNIATSPYRTPTTQCHCSCAQVTVDVPNVAFTANAATAGSEIHDATVVRRDTITQVGLGGDMKRSLRLPWYVVALIVGGAALLLVIAVAVVIVIAVVAARGAARSHDAVVTVNQCHDDPTFTKAGQPKSCDSDLGGEGCCFKCCTPFVSAHTCLGQTAGVVNFQSGLTCPTCAAATGGCAQRGAVRVWTLISLVRIAPRFPATLSRGACARSLSLSLSISLYVSRSLAGLCSLSLSRARALTLLRLHPTVARHLIRRRRPSA